MTAQSASPNALSRSRFKSLSVLILFVSWLLFLWRGAGPLPPLGPLLDVHSGVWRHRPRTLSPKALPGLHHKVDVAWDRQGVPHFFAQDAADLYLAQGFVMASQRLFQMDLTTRVMAGRLSEWVGPKALETDRFFVRFGMRESARKVLARYMQDETAKAMITRYIEGVNAYIASLEEETLPVEYKILGAHPEPFDPLRVIYMDRTLTYDLSSRSFALYLTKMQQTLGTEKVLDLFPEFLPAKFEDYVMSGQPHASPSSSASSSPPRREAESARLFTFVSHLKDLPALPLANPRNGSNNWAVGPGKSASGFSLLANDTHLGYSLPNVWYENQLWTPEFNVYGASLVSIPGIVNGFNANRVAWGPTNGTTTTLDFFEVEFENENSLRYRQAGEWFEPDVQQEIIKIKGGREEAVPVAWTRLGSLIHREGKYGLVAHWLGHRANQELKALAGLYPARDMKECRRSFTNWAVPIQNFICADPGHISIRHTGFVPRRKVGSGRFIMDGGQGEDTFAVEVPEAFHPELKDPPSGFVLSANQKVEAPGYPYYLGWDYEEAYRGLMIRQRLDEKEKISSDDMMRIQNDSHDAQAEFILPYLLKLVRRDSLSAEQVKALENLDHWDYEARAAETAPAVFKAWLSALNHTLFDPVIAPIHEKRLFPKSLRLAWMLERLTKNSSDSDRQWVVNGDLGGLVTSSFQLAWQNLGHQLGADQRGWIWSRWNNAQLTHVARLPGFGSDLLTMDGSGESIHGNHGNHGPVYKAVMELSDPPKAWMQIPGGNEGDPFSKDYARYVEEWSGGKMRPVEFYQNVEEARAKALRVTELTPEPPAGASR